MNFQNLRRSNALIPGTALLLSVVAYISVPMISGTLLTPFDTFNAFEQFAQVGLLTVGFGLAIIAGEFDLSIVAVFALSGVLAVQFGQQNPFLSALIAVAISAVFGAAQGLIIAKSRIASMPVTLATYLALLELTRLIGSDQASVSFSNTESTLWLQDPVGQLFSPRSLVVIAVIITVGLALSLTRWGRELRALGGDRDGSRVAGVPVTRRLVALFATTSALGALGGALTAFTTGAALTDPGSSTLILAAAGALIGGVVLTGGRGSVAGIVAGTGTVVLVQQMFVLSGAAETVTDLVFGAILLAFAVVNSPMGREPFQRLTARRKSSTYASHFSEVAP